jgi:hypothetical protein
MRTSLLTEALGSSAWIAEISTTITKTPTAKARDRETLPRLVWRLISRPYRRTMRTSGERRTFTGCVGRVVGAPVGSRVRFRNGARMRARATP